ncbi:MAG TPA: response regulator transcription factor [Terriglobales bacterium]|nr:response regulator transcription factor [Terriglobales bacterium]
MKQLIFVIEDEPEVCELAQWCLEEAGYAVRTFSTSNVIQEAEHNHPSLMLITMMMPDGNGLDLCRQIRANRALARTPIVFLIPEAAGEHRAVALESGADDCIVKPFSPRELVARVQAVLRRFAPANGRSRLEPADLVIDSLAMKVSVRGSEVPTTSLEFRLIEYLARHRGQVFTRDLLLDAVWGDMQFVTPRSVDACIRRIREKIEPDRTSPTYLKTIRGVGYRLDAVATWQLTPNDGCTCLACTTPPGASRLAHSTERRRRPAS